MLVRHITRCTLDPIKLTSKHQLVKPPTSAEMKTDNNPITTCAESKASVAASTMSCQEGTIDSQSTIADHARYILNNMLASVAVSASKKNPIIKQELAKSTAASGQCLPKSVVIDLSKIEMLDSATASTRKSVKLGSRSDQWKNLTWTPPDESIALRVQMKISAAAEKARTQTLPAVHSPATPVLAVHPPLAPFPVAHDNSPSSVHKRRSPIPASSHHDTHQPPSTTIPVPMPRTHASLAQCPICARSFPRMVRDVQLTCLSLFSQRLTSWSSLVLRY